MLRSTDIYSFFVDSRILDMEAAGPSETLVNSYQLHMSLFFDYSRKSLKPHTHGSRSLVEMLTGIEPDKKFQPHREPHDSSSCSKKPAIFTIMLHALTTVIIV
jgi:hypothetical protein